MAVWLRRHHHRTRTLITDSEPASKGRGGERAAAALQRQVMDEMEKWRWYPMTGTVALDLHLKAARKNPPTVYRAAKHALDALGPALPYNIRPRRRHILYHDDRQIKFLYVDLDQAWSRRDPECTGSMFIMIRRARDVILDLRAAELVSREEHDDEKSRFTCCPYPTNLWSPIGCQSAALTSAQWSNSWPTTVATGTALTCRSRSWPALMQSLLRRSAATSALWSRPELHQDWRRSSKSRGRRAANCFCRTHLCHRFRGYPGVQVRPPSSRNRSVYVLKSSNRAGQHSNLSPCR